METLPLWVCGNDFRAFQSLFQLLSIKQFHRNFEVFSLLLERLQLFHLARVVRAILPEEIAVTLHHSEGHRAIILLPGKHCHSCFVHWAWKPVKIVSLIVLENPPAVGKRVIANIGRLSSPDTSVHLQVPSLAQGQVSQVTQVGEPSNWKWLITRHGGRQT